MEKKYTLDEIQLRIKKLSVDEMKNIRLIKKWKRIQKKLYPESV